MAAAHIMPIRENKEYILTDKFGRILEISEIFYKNLLEKFFGL
jgi:hypothetical protein